MNGKGLLGIVVLVTANAFAFWQVSSLLGEGTPPPDDIATAMSELSLEDYYTKNGVVAVGILNPNEAESGRLFVEDLRQIDAPHIKALTVAAVPLNVEVVRGQLRHVLRTRKELIETLRNHGAGVSRWLVLREGHLVATGNIRAGGLISALETLSDPGTQDRGIAADVQRVLAGC